MADRIAQWTENAGWVRGLARHLVSDPHGADDVAQEALVAALDAGRAEPAWLRGVVRLLAANRRRAARRREDRERLVAARRDGLVPPVADTVARVEQERLLVDAVMTLEQPFRDVVLLRYFDDLAPREIARRLGVPVATVHSRLGRAVARLRERLDRAHGGDRRRWVTALGPLVGAGARPGAGVAAVVGVVLMNKLLLAGAAVVLAALVWWAAASSRGVEGGQPRIEVPVVAEQSGSDGDLDGLDDQVPGRREVVAQQGAPGSTVAPVESGADAIRLVQVVDGQSGMPLPEAEVHRLRPDLQFQRRRQLDRWREGFILDQCFEFGDRVELDDAACFAVADPATSSLWGARFGELRGFLAPRSRGVAEQPGATVRLALMPFRTWSVRVQDEAGRPVAGVPVALCVDRRGMLFNQTIERTRAADGIAELRFVALPGLTIPGALAVRLWFPGAPTDAVPIRQDAAPGEDVVLTCPPLGSARVEVRIDTITTRAAGDVLRVVLDDGAERHGLDTFDALLEDGVASFDPVAATEGLSLRAQVVALSATDVRAPTRELAVLRGPGPSRPGQQVVLRDSETRYEVRMRLLCGERGTAEPLRNEAVHRWLLPQEDPSAWNERTDGAGVLRAPLDPALVEEDAEDGAEPRSLRIRLEEGPQSERTVPIPDHVVAAARAQAGGPDGSVVVLDLGDVYFPASRVFARGVVVDREGRPVVGVFARLGSLVRRGTGSSPSYQPVPGMPGGVTDAEGRFEVVGTVDSLTGLDAPGSLWMTVLGDDRWSCAPRAVTDPMNVVLVVDRLGGLAGHVALESADAFTSLRVELFPPGTRSAGSSAATVAASGARSGTAEAVGSWGRNAPLEVDGSFAMSGVPPGRCALRVLLPGGREVARVHELTVEGGVVARPAALDPLDLRGRVLELALDVRNEAGERVDATVSIPRWAGSIGRSDMPVLLRPEERRILLTADGYVTADIDVEPPKQTVVLSRARR